VERTKVFIHVVDGAALEGVDPLENIDKIEQELEKYKEGLSKRPTVIAVNKMDIPGAEENLAKIKAKYEAQGFTVLPISAATNEGLDELLAAVANILKDYPEDIVFDEEYDEFEEAVSTDNEPFTITKADEGYYVVEGVGVEKMIGYTNIDTEKGFAFFQKYLRDRGIIDALTEAGITDGETVRIYDLEFEFYK
jgi:GTP-binding protein